MRTLIYTMTAVAAFVVLLAGLGFATDQSDFCQTCHEMRPFHDAWQTGPHAEEAECIECHVDEGLLARAAHKPEAVGEVIAHIRGDTSFPRPQPTAVPDSRCTGCHQSIDDADDRPDSFSHELHTQAGSCASCHSVTGHAVSREALEAAGVFDAEAAASREPTLPASAIAAPGAGTLNVEGHPEVACAACHDIARSGCMACHAQALPAEHPADEECDVCHPSASDWTFAHPSSNACASCHEPPATGEHPGVSDCAVCHDVEGEWAFVHPADGTCADCHAPPILDEHPDRDDCGTCHSVSGGWDHDR